MYTIVVLHWSNNMYVQLVNQLTNKSATEKFYYNLQIRLLYSYRRTEQRVPATNKPSDRPIKLSSLKACDRDRTISIS